jgi:hypothetical protein
MLFPGSTDLMLVPPDELESCAQSASGEAIVLCQLNLRLKPELCFPFHMVYMHMRTELLPREEEKPKTLLAEDGGAHADILHPTRILEATEIYSLDPRTVWSCSQTWRLSIGLT